MSDLKHPFISSIYKVQNKLDLLLKEIKLKQIQDPEYIFLDNSDLMRLLKISSGTAKNWRETGLIAFSQPSNKIYYKLSDVSEFLKRHYKPFKKK